MTRMLGQRAVVVGASVAGLLASRALSEHFDEVVVLDSDEIEDGPVVHKSVPQGYHLHALLQGGLRVLSSLYPAFTEDGNTGMRPSMKSMRASQSSGWRISAIVGR